MALKFLFNTKAKELPRAQKNGRHTELCDVAAKWLTRYASAKGGQMQIGLAELGTNTVKEKPDAFGFDQMGESTIVEVKVSRADFLADKNKPFRANPDTGMGDFRYYMCPTGLITEEDLAGTKWGLIWVSPKGICKVIRGRATKNVWTPEWHDSWRFTKDVNAENDLIRTLFLRMSYNIDISGFLDGVKCKSKIEAALINNDPAAATIRRMDRANVFEQLKEVARTNDGTKCLRCLERDALALRSLRKQTIKETL